jgi:hypothetical protein
LPWYRLRHPGLVEDHVHGLPHLHVAERLLDLAGPVGKISRVVWPWKPITSLPDAFTSFTDVCGTKVASICPVFSATPRRSHS